MLNHSVIIGRLVHDPEPIVLDDGRKVLDMTLAVQRPFKNHDGNYDTDFLKVSLWEGLAHAVSSYCKKGVMIAVKGRLQTKKYKIEERTVSTIEVVGERVTYLAPKTKESMISTIEND